MMGSVVLQLKPLTFACPWYLNVSVCPEVLGFSGKLTLLFLFLRWHCLSLCCKPPRIQEYSGNF